MRWLFTVATLLVAAFLAACSSPAPAPYQPAVARLFLEAKPGEPGLEVTLPESGVTLTVGAKPVFLESDVLNAEVVEVDLGRCLLVQLTSAAARDLYRLSVAARGRRLVLAVDNHLLGARRIDEPIADGRLLVFVEMPDGRLPTLVARLKRGVALLASAEPSGKPN